MQRIIVRRRDNLTASVDDADYPALSAHLWYLWTIGKKHYAATRVNGRIVYMHRMLSGAPCGHEVDHIDGNGLNNCRSNLRVVTSRGNQLARSITNECSLPPGVSRVGQRFRARIRNRNKKIHIGTFDSPGAAHSAYLSARASALRSETIS